MNIDLINMENQRTSEPLISEGCMLQPCQQKIGNYVLNNCMHTFCSTCLSHYLVEKIDEQYLIDIKCLLHQCSSTFSLSEIKLLVDSAAYTKYLMKYLTRMQDSHINIYCPIEECYGYLTARGPNQFVCDRCDLDLIVSRPNELYSQLISKNSLSQKSEDLGIILKHCPCCGTVSKREGFYIRIICRNCCTGWCWDCEKEYINHDLFICVLGKSKLNLYWGIILLLILFPLCCPFGLTLLLIFTMKYEGPIEKADLPSFVNFLPEYPLLILIISGIISPAVTAFALLTSALYFGFSFATLLIPFNKSRLIWLSEPGRGGVAGLKVRSDST